MANYGIDQSMISDYLVFADGIFQMIFLTSSVLARKKRSKADDEILMIPTMIL